MDIIQLKQLIEHIKTLPIRETPEATIFSIGSRGYYENPTSDVLAFFCDSEGDHGLGSLMIEALFEALAIANPDCPILDVDDFSVINPPEREAITKGKKRIDLLLEGNEWVMLIENKIYHHQANPFDSYIRHVESNNGFKEKKSFYVVLSPDGQSPDDWLGLSYPVFINVIKQKLSETFISQPLNKWMLLLREFILHLEGIMTGSNIEEDTAKYVLGNLSQIKDIQDLKVEVVTAFKDELAKKVESVFPKDKVDTKIHHWYGFPVLRFTLESWRTESVVVMFLDGRKDKKYCVDLYAYDITTPKEHGIAEAFLKQDDCTKDWLESSGTIKCFRTYYDCFDKGTAHELLIKKLKLLDEFETKVRSQW